MPMQLADVPTVSAVERSVFSLPWSTSAFTYDLTNNPNAEYLVVRYLPWMAPERAEGRLARSMRRLLKPPQQDPSLIGYGGLWMVLEEGHICTLAVRAAWRGRGLGELLLAGLIERARARGAEVMTLEVRVSNVTAQNLYLKYGFRVVGRRKGYYTDNREDALVMTTDSIVAPGYGALLATLTEQLHARLVKTPEAPASALKAPRAEDVAP
ncbi:MAG TPA: ribosomal protein S18-alanine N-acetyltransferase [Chloroflexi bacterium]|nr:ribosomal protein S18-alanine N-acetyltransferase [Chloroflexota bacterium]